MYFFALISKTKTTGTIETQAIYGLRSKRSTSVLLCVLSHTAAARVFYVLQSTLCLCVRVCAQVELVLFIYVHWWFRSLRPRRPEGIFSVRAERKTRRRLSDSINLWLAPPAPIIPECECVSLLLVHTPPHIPPGIRQTSRSARHTGPTRDLKRRLTAGANSLLLLNHARLSHQFYILRTPKFIRATNWGGN